LGPRARLNQDSVAGLMFIVAGAAGLWFGRGYSLGTSTTMGPGTFPLLLSALLIAFGVINVLRGALIGGARLTGWHLRPVVMVTLAFLVFAALIDRAGLTLATILAVLTGALGGAEFKLREQIVLAVALAAAAVALFIYGLGLPMKAWPI
jgi:putative tricarboxylic transport membrane protein